MQPQADTGHPDSWWVDSTLITRGQEAWLRAPLGTEGNLVENTESHPADLKAVQEAYAGTLILRATPSFLWAVHGQ